LSRPPFLHKHVHRVYHVIMTHTRGFWIVVTSVNIFSHLTTKFYSRVDIIDKWLFAMTVKAPQLQHFESRLLTAMFIFYRQSLV